jgi:hypothetical protein
MGHMDNKMWQFYDVAYTKQTLGKTVAANQTCPFLNILGISASEWITVSQELE